MKPKPVHLEDAYAQQFADRSVARAYYARPPYPPGAFELLDTLIAAKPRNVLELGAGTGDLTVGLSPFVDRIDALEPAPAMIEAAQARAALMPNVTWIPSKAESHEFQGPYAAVIAAESLHWMDWEIVFPKIERSLSRDGFLVLVFDRNFVSLPWEAPVSELIARYSTNRHFKPYDLVSELNERGLIEERGRKQIVGPAFSQSLDDYVESFHSRNGFSRERMGDSGDAFDKELRQLVGPDAPRGRIDAPVATTVVWGKVHTSTR